MACRDMPVWIIPVVDPAIKRWPTAADMILRGVPPMIASRYHYLRHVYTCGLIIAVQNARN